MQKHLEWLKARIVVTEQMEKELLEEEKQQIMDAFDEGKYLSSGKNFNGETYYNIFNK